MPEIGPKDVLIRVQRTGVCGTDLHIYNWDEWASRTVPVPMIIGHEYAGEIVEIGGEVDNVTVGQRVSGEGHVIGMHSRAARAGRFHLDPETRGVGVNIPGAFAEYVRIPAFNVVTLPDDVDDEIGAILDPLGNAVHTALSFDLVGEDVLITGAGPIGIMSAAVARHVGARHIVITDVNPVRLKLAAEVTDVVPVNAAEEDLAAVMTRLGMKEGFDVGLEMSGVPAALDQMLDHMVVGGRIALLGIPAKPSLVDLNKIIFRQIIRQGHLRPRDVRDLAQDAGHAAKRPRRPQGHHPPAAGGRIRDGLPGDAGGRMRQGGAGVVSTRLRRTAISTLNTPARR